MSDPGRIRSMGPVSLLRVKSAAVTWVLTSQWAIEITRGPEEFAPPCGSMRGNVKRKYFSLELKWAEDVVSGIQPPCHALCQCVVTKCLGCSDPRADHAHFTPWSSNVVADQREAVGGCWFRLSAFPLNGNVFCRTAWSGQGRTDRCGAANPLPRGPFCDHGERGKAES